MTTANDNVIYLADAVARRVAKERRKPREHELHIFLKHVRDFNYQRSNKRNPVGK